MFLCVTVQVVEEGCLPSLRHLVVVTVLVNVVIHQKCHKEGCRCVIVVLPILIHWPWEVEEKRQRGRDGKEGTEREREKQN